MLEWQNNHINSYSSKVCITFFLILTQILFLRLLKYIIQIDWTQCLYILPYLILITFFWIRDYIKGIKARRMINHLPRSYTAKEWRSWCSMSCLLKPVIILVSHTPEEWRVYIPRCPIKLPEMHTYISRLLSIPTLNDLIYTLSSSYLYFFSSTVLSFPPLISLTAASMIF